MLKYSFRPVLEYVNIPWTPKLYIFYFFIQYKSGKNITFNNKKINKSNFYKNKKLFKIDEIDANKILVSKKEPYGGNKSIKYFIGHNDEMSLDHYV